MRNVGFRLFAAFIMFPAVAADSVKEKEIKPGGLDWRAPEQRAKVLEEEGGNKESEDAVAKGLMFLAPQQAADGHWSMHEFNRDARRKLEEPKRFRDGSTPHTARKDDIAGTAFGLLPFLGGGYTHKAEVKNGPDFRPTVRAGLHFLLKKQQPDGSFPGGGGDNMYAQALGTIVLCEAYGLSGDPALKMPAQSAIDYLVKAQHDGGGWRYGPKQPGDLSVTGWVVSALRTGSLAGLTVPPAVYKTVGKFLDTCENDGATATPLKAELRLG